MELQSLGVFEFGSLGFKRETKCGFGIYGSLGGRARAYLWGGAGFDFAGGYASLFHEKEGQSQRQSSG